MRRLRSLKYNANSLILFRYFFFFLFASSIGILVPLLLIVGLSRLNVLDANEIWLVVKSPIYLVVSGVIVTGLVLPLRTKNDSPESVDDQYSFAEKCLHRLAFHTKPLQVATADLESLLIVSKTKNARVETPCFCYFDAKSRYNATSKYMLSVTGLLLSHLSRNAIHLKSIFLEQDRAVIL